MTATPTPALSQKAELLAQADKYRWFHRISLFEDYVTPGIDNTPEKLAQLDGIGLPRDMTGLRVLDIGAWDGFFSFECAARGAEVLALDHVQPTDTGFLIASKALGHDIPWRVENIYRLSAEEIGTFDIVLCLGVIYHLRHLLLGLDRVRGVMKEGAQLFVETAAIDNHALLNSGDFGRLSEACPGAHQTPLLQFYPDGELGGDPTNVFAPNHAGLLALLGAAEFEVEDHALAPPHLPTRSIARARAISNPETAFYRERDAATLPARVYFEH
jgi:tRNA (mo5U34)-methyltransferase